ncbi:MAG: GNAT family N-acetyltransferase [Miniphocaeibacter sp.]|uniref:GNAT family N-acetyltransferase n=1 Tax=Miniphocaeibacter sp. TaxID=3100973 RepID=UPI0017F30BD8|nr:GNAT family N-acetyltransferase [Gallicola sp.]
MEIEILRTIEEIEEIKEDWETIEKMNNNNIYVQYGFIKNWVENVFDKNDVLFIIVVKEKDSILGIAPLYIQIRKILSFRIKELKFIGNGDYKNFILKEDFSNKYSIIKKILDVIFENDNLFDRIVLEKIESKSNLAYYFLKDDRYNKNFNFYNETPFLNLKKIRNGELKLSKPSKVNKFKNKLKRDLGYKFEVEENINKELFNEIINLHLEEQEYLKEEMNRRNRRSIFFQEGLNNFYKSTVVNNSKMILFILKTDNDEIINYKLCYKENKIIYSWNSAYNIKYESFSPNSVIYKEIFDYLLDFSDIEIFDFGAGRYPWKFKWTKDFNIVYNFESWNEKNWKIKMIKKLINIKNKF